MNFDPPGFTGMALDRADNLRLIPERIAELSTSPEARLMLLDGLDARMDDDGGIVWESPNGQDPGALIFLGLAGNAPLFAPLAPVADTGPRPARLLDMFGIMAPGDAALWGTVRSLLSWHGRHCFCSNCGTPTDAFRAGWGRKCSNCGADHFPRVDPVVIMLAEHEGRVLVARQPQFPPNRYSALAGYVEPGESIEEAVARELAEEAGIRVSNVRYLASQPWPFPGSLMIACLADAESDALTLDTTELEQAMWVDRKDVAAALAETSDARFLAPPPYAIAHTLFRRWLGSWIEGD